MGNCYNYTPIPPAEASCIIAHLFVELALPCSCCKREDGVIVIQGKTYDGSSARVTIKGEEVRYPDTRGHLKAASKPCTHAFPSYVRFLAFSHLWHNITTPKLVKSILHSHL